MRTRHKWQELRRARGTRVPASAIAAGLLPAPALADCIGEHCLDKYATAYGITAILVLALVGGVVTLIIRRRWAANVARRRKPVAPQPDARDE